jgi:tRNA and rRNA cytosine-C5-methylases
MKLSVDFVSRTKLLLGEEFPSFEKALEVEPCVSVRLNLNKGVAVPEGMKMVPWCSSGFYLPERLTFTFDPLFHAGAYYVQEASSMFLEQAVREYVKTPVRCLDLCAAPGGKSTLLANVLPEGSLLVSNEVIRSRSFVLAENMTKWGAPNTVVTNNDPEEIGKLSNYFDVIVADVPCSGEGMFRKDVESRDEWSVANVQLCAARQRRIINDIWDALKPGGILIYSTCTYNTEENEDNILYIGEELGAEALPLAIDAGWNISGALKGDLPVYRFLPHKAEGEGFFLAVLRKTEGEYRSINLKQKNKNKKEQKNAPIPQDLYGWIEKTEDYTLDIRNGVVEAYPSYYKDDYALLCGMLKIVSAGVAVGEIKGKDIIPNHSLSLSNILNRDSFVQVELTWDEAIAFLRREAVAISNEVKKGYVLLTYKNYPLGFVKHLGNRANNLYPQEWRIRTGYNPVEIKTLF